MDNPLISVIVPIYKVEKYLNRCIESIVNQTYSNLEIILVDDGSPDYCPQMCDDWAVKDNRIKVIHKENGGLSDARNAGMKIATGEYISFIDSDDYVSLDFFETLLSIMTNEQSDIVECSVVKFYEYGSINEYLDDSDILSFETESALSGLISEKPFHQHVWNKLYKADTVKGITFPVGKLNEDEFWTYQVFGNAKKVTKINKTMYFYFQRSGSIMGQNYSIRRLDALEGKANRQKYIEKEYPVLSLQAKTDLYGSCIYAYLCALKCIEGEEKRIAIDKIKEYKKEYKLAFKEIKQVKGGVKKYYYLSKVNLYLCCKVMVFFGVGF